MRPGTNPRYVARDSKAFAVLRESLGGKQGNFKGVVGTATLSRFENGGAMYKWNLDKLYNHLVELANVKQKDLAAFGDLFESALPDNYDWGMVMKWARRAGKWTFRKFRANCLLTTPGASAIFANLMMATTLSPPEFLLKPVHVASFLKGADATVSTYKGLDTIKVGRYTILVPKSYFRVTASARGESRLSTTASSLGERSQP
jgi:hypothetical protein